MEDKSKLNKFKNILKNSSVKDFAIYMGFDSFNKALPFLLVPIIANYITTSEYGLVTNFLILYQIFYIFITFNSFTKLTTSYFKIKSNLSPDFSNYIYFSLIASTIILLLIIIGHSFLENFSKISILYQIIALLTALFAIVVNLYTTVLRMSKKPLAFGLLQTSQSLGLFIFTLIFVVFLLWGWTGRIYAQFLSSFISVLICIVIINKSENITFKKLELLKIKDTFKWGLPLIPHSLSFWLKSGVDKIIITNILGLSANGVYSVAMTFGGIISLFTTSFFNMYSPRVYEMLTEHELCTDVHKKHLLERTLAKNILYFVFFLLLVCFVAYFILIKIVNLFFTGDYLLSIPLIHLVLIGSFLSGVYSMISVFLFYKNKTKLLGTITFTLSLFQAGITFFAVSYIGISGALYSNIFISIVSVLLILFFTNKDYKLLTLKSFKIKYI